MSVLVGCFGHTVRKRATSQFWPLNRILKIRSAGFTSESSCPTCHHAAKQLVREDTSAGVQVNCSKCGSNVTVPNAASVYTCPHSDCGQAMNIDTTLKGERLQCPLKVTGTAAKEVGVKNPIYEHQFPPPCPEFMPHGICAQWGVYPMLGFGQVRFSLTVKKATGFRSVRGMFP